MSPFSKKGAILYGFAYICKKQWTTNTHIYANGSWNTNAYPLLAWKPNVASQRTRSDTSSKKGGTFPVNITMPWKGISPNTGIPLWMRNDQVHRTAVVVPARCINPLKVRYAGPTTVLFASPGHNPLVHPATPSGFAKTHPMELPPRRSGLSLYRTSARPPLFLPKWQKACSVFAALTEISIVPPISTHRMFPSKDFGINRARTSLLFIPIPFEMKL